MAVSSSGSCIPENAEANKKSEGPAEVDGGILKFTPIPPRAKFPVKVTVVAWQYGRPTEPKLKTAEPVARKFLIERN
jgi:hypothetical protein